MASALIRDTKAIFFSNSQMSQTITFSGLVTAAKLKYNWEQKFIEILV